MEKIEKLTATTVQHGLKTVMNIAIKLENGLLVQGNIPVRSGSNGSDSDKAAAIVNDIISQIVEGLNPLRQKELDKMITELTQVHDQNTIQTNISLGISQTLVKVSAALHNQTVYEYLRTIYNLPIPPNHQLTPVFTCVENVGEMGEFKEFFIIPSRNKSIEDSFTIFRKFFSTLHDNSRGEKIEIMNTVQLEIIQNMLVEMGLGMHHDVFLGVRPELKQSATSEFMCNDMLHNVSQEQIIDYFNELQTLYAPLITETPFIHHNMSAYTDIHKAIGDKTILTLSTNTIDTPHKCRQMAANLPGSMLNINSSQVQTVSQCIDLLIAARENELKLMIDTNGLEDRTVLHAIAAAGGCDFIKIDSATVETEKDFSYDQ